MEEVERCFSKSEPTLKGSRYEYTVLLETEIRGTEDKGLNKIRCSHRWVKDRYLRYFSSPAMYQLLMSIVRLLINAYESKD